MVAGWWEDSFTTPVLHGKHRFRTAVPKVVCFCQHFGWTGEISSSCRTLSVNASRRTIDARICRGFYGAVNHTRLPLATCSAMARWVEIVSGESKTLTPKNACQHKPKTPQLVSMWGCCSQQKINEIVDSLTRFDPPLSTINKWFATYSSWLGVQFCICDAQLSLQHYSATKLFKTQCASGKYHLA